MDTPIDMERWFGAARSRKSVRNFGGPPDGAQLQRLTLLASALNGGDVRIALIEATPALFSGLIARRLKSAKCAAAVIIRDGVSLTRAGYIGEAFVLECTAMGLGTCWLGGSYNKKEAKRLCGAESGETLRALIALGQPEEPLSEIPDSGRKRKELDKLVITSKGVSLADMSEWQNAALKCARIAPSAVNMQPWRFAFMPGHICMAAAGLFGEGAQLDLGIAMIHVELGAASRGIRGVWDRRRYKKGEWETPEKADGPGTVWVFSELPSPAVPAVTPDDQA